MSDTAPKTQKRFGRWSKLLAVVLVLGAGLVFFLPGRAIPLPDWAVLRIQDRLNDTLRRSLPDVRLSMETLTVTIGRDLTPQLDLTGVRLVNPAGAEIVTLPELALTLAPAALLGGKLHPRSLRLIGADVTVTRDATGQMDLAFARQTSSNRAMNLPDIFALSDQILTSPMAVDLTRIQAESLSVRLIDQRTGQNWQLGDGLLDITNRAQDLTAELQMSLQQGPKGNLGRMVVSIVAPRHSNQARITASLENVAAADLAGQIAPLAFVGLLNAPLSGQVGVTVTPQGIAALAAELTFGKGVLQPNAAAQPIAFDQAAMKLVYDPDMGRINLTELHLQSAVVQVNATGHGDLLRRDGSPITGAITSEMPDAFVVQLQIKDARIDRPETFAQPVQFDAGALDMRLRVTPFSLELGQLALTSGKTRILARGQASAGGAGWLAALDVHINDITASATLGIWPKTVLPGTRQWFDHNMQAGTLTDVKAALRIAQDSPPVIALGYNYHGATVRVMPSLPPITDGAGYGAIANNVLTVVLEKGRVTPPQGGDLDLSGSVFRIKDIREIPGLAQITLQSRGPLTATLSLLDQKPFLYLQKAGRPVDFGQGQAHLVTQLQMRLKKKIMPGDVSFQVAGHVYDFGSDQLVIKHRVTSANLTVQVDNKGLQFSGQGLVGVLPFDAIYQQSFSPADKGHAQLIGQVTLSDPALRDFGIVLPPGAITGQGQGDVTLDFTKGAPAKLHLQSDLNRIGLAIPALAWAKPAASLGKLDLRATLSIPPVVDELSLSAAGLAAHGKITLNPKGVFALADFDRVTLDEWLDCSLQLTPAAKTGDGMALAITAGAVDLRFLPKFGAPQATAPTPLVVQLDRLRVSDGIVLTDVSGGLQIGGDIRGELAARVDAGPAIKVQVAPSQNGPALRVLSQDAGAVFAAAHIFGSARGGALDLRLTPSGAGEYDGNLAIRNIRVQNASVLAELLNAVSVVGLLDQLGGEGILFNNVTGRFRLTPQAVEVQEGAATGASLGVTMQGVYQSDRRQLDMQGTISPVYMLNVLGEFIARRGEGVLGFNYSLKGAADAPDISVNPLSVLTPGFLRDVFRGPAAKLKKAK